MQFIHEENSNIQSVEHIPNADFGNNRPTNGSGQQGRTGKSAPLATSPLAKSLAGCAAATSDAKSALVPYLQNPASTATGTAVGFPPRDDLDLMLKHEDFPRILIFSTKIKQYREFLFHAPRGQHIVLSGPVDELVDKDDAQVLAAVTRMQNQLLSPVCRQEMDGVVVRRGEYPLTDATIDDAAKSLEQEFEHICKFVQRALNRQNNAATSGGGKKESAAIAVKYSKWQTDLLMGWMIENVHHPFPSHDDIRDLMQCTGLSQSQVVNWTTNVRKRNRKATCENGKKPHHFIDFMFLAHYDNEEDRKQRERGESVQDYGQIQSSASYTSNNSNLTTSTTATKKASPSSRSNKKKGNKKTDSANMPPSPKQLISAPVTPPDALASRRATPAAALANHPGQAGGHHDQYYYELQQHYSQSQYEHGLHDDPYNYHQEYEHFQQLHRNTQSRHPGQHYHQGEGGMYISPVQTLASLSRDRDNEDYDHDSSSRTDSSDRDRHDDREHAHSLARAIHYQEGEPDNHIDPEPLFAGRDGGHDKHDEREQDLDVPEVQHRWGTIADSNTAELFSGTPFWGGEIGEDHMVLGGLAWLGGRGDLPGHLDRNEDDVNDDGDDDEQDDSNNNDDAATTTTTSADDGEQQPIDQQEQLYLCEWIPSILPTVTQDSSDFWLSIQAPLPPLANHSTGTSGGSSSRSRIGAAGPKRGRINTIDVTSELALNDTNHQEDETAQQWALSLGVEIGI
jgi:Homeobox KN domain